MSVLRFNPPPDEEVFDTGFWLHGGVTCRSCLHQWFAVYHEDSDGGLECPSCGVFAGRTTDEDDEGAP